MSQPRLLLVDDEPVLAQFMADAALGCGFAPVVTSDDQQFRSAFLAQEPEMVASGVRADRFMLGCGLLAVVLSIIGIVAVLRWIL